jgi:hypothetical protein
VEDELGARNRAWCDFSLSVSLGVEDKKEGKGDLVRRKIGGWGMRESERSGKKINKQILENNI